MHSLPILTRLIAANLLARQNKALLAEIAYFHAQAISWHTAALHRCLPEAPGPGHRVDPWQRLAQITTVAKAGTIRNWRRLMRAGKLGVRHPSPGRVRTKIDVE